MGAGGAITGSQMGQGQWGQGRTDDWRGMGLQGAGGPDGSCWGWWGRRWVMGQEGQIAGVVGQEGDGREPDGAGAVGARRVRWSTSEEMAGYRRARWQFLWVVGQEGGWQGARWGRDSRGKEGQMAGEGGDGRVPEGQMEVAGAVGC